MHSRILSMTALAALALAALPLSPAGAATTPQISDAARTAILRALDDEYHAEATYAAVIDRFGAVRPFVNIVRAEQMHESLVIGLMQTYGIAVPANPYTTGAKPLAPVPATLAEACATGVAAETANKQLYDVEILPVVADYPDITSVVTRLRDASQLNHLPAFQRCAP